MRELDPVDAKAMCEAGREVASPVSIDLHRTMAEVNTEHHRTDDTSSKGAKRRCPVIGLMLDSNG